MASKFAERLRPVFRFRRIGFEALAIATGQALSALGGVVAVRVLTEAMPPRQYGELALAMTVGTLGLQIFLAPLSTSAMRFYAPAAEAEDLNSFLAAVRKLVVQAVSVIGLIAMVGMAVVTAASHAVWIPLIVAACLYTVFTGTTAVFDGLQNAARHRVVAATHSGIAPWLRFLLAVWLIHLAGKVSSAVAMSGYALASALVMTSQLFFFRRKIASQATRPAADVPYWRSSILSYGLPFATWGIFTWAQSASDRWALGVFAGAADVGYYAVTYQLGYIPIVMASTLIGQVAAPILFARAGDASDPARVHDAVRLNARLVVLMLLLTAAGFGIVQLVYPYIGRLLLASGYRGVSFLLPWMVVAGGLFATAQTGSLFFMITNRSAALTAPKICSAIVGVVLNVIGARWLGVYGVISAVISTQLFFCFWIMIIATRTYRSTAAS